MKYIHLVFLATILKNGNIVSSDVIVPDYKNVFDLSLYESVLDSELCEEQLRYIQQNDQELLLEFIDAGIRTPRGILIGNTVDLGNYYQCLDINRPIPNSVVEGKYCMINLPLNQSLLSLRILPEWPELNPKTSRLLDEVVSRMRDYNERTLGIRLLNGEGSDVARIFENPLAALTFRLAVCVPKVCSTRTALSSFFNGSELGIVDFEEAYCRLPNDKLWVAGDYVAVAIFSFIGLLVVLSTAYDVLHNVVLQKDLKESKEINKLYLAFSAYTNTRLLITYNPVPGAIECLDGIRSFAMMWVIVGHTFVTRSSSGILANPLDALNWMTSLKAVWISAAPITVDTFFMLSGLLLVYTTAGKLTSVKLLKNLHFFYLNRLLRMFPVLAAAILLQVSVLNRVADGPYWNVVMNHTHRCRLNWWSTLLHIQNYLNPADMCLAHSWYLAIDVQLHIISPIVLFWVLTGRRRLAWTALVGAMIAVLAASSTYNFIMKFPPGTTIPSRRQDAELYLYSYYVNTLTRAAPFFVGLILGYILHLNRGKQVVLSIFSATILWASAVVISMLCVYSTFPIMQLDWDNQFADSMINSFQRPAWAMSVGWLIFACTHGYGGPINWLLSLRAWKVLSRLSYAMYILHYPLMFVIKAMPVAPIYFTVRLFMFQFLADFSLAVIVAFIVTIMIDAPCSVLIKHCLGPGPKRPPRKVANKKINEEHNPGVRNE